MHARHIDHMITTYMTPDTRHDTTRHDNSSGIAEIKIGKVDFGDSLSLSLSLRERNFLLCT